MPMSSANVADNKVPLIASCVIKDDEIDDYKCHGIYQHFTNWVQELSNLE